MAKLVDWTDAEIEALIVHYKAGLSTAEIGRLIGRSKNGIIGKSHRLMDLGLIEPRPSPIVRSGSGPKPHPPKPAETLPPLPSVKEIAMFTPPPKPPRQASFTLQTANVRAVFLPPPVVKRPIFEPTPKGDRVVPCQYPFGDPRRRETFRFCEAASAPGWSYCPTHVALCYVQVRDRREDAA